MQLSKNITLDEMTSSRTARLRGIANTPDDRIIESMEALCGVVIQPIRDYFGRPVRIHSGYRCKELNAAVGGVETSQHVKGEACDFSIGGVALSDIMEWIVFHSELAFDQVILEPGWIHISYTLARPQRFDALIKTAIGYESYIR